MSDVPDLPGFSTVESPVETPSQSATPEAQTSSPGANAADEMPEWMRDLTPDESVASATGASASNWLANLPGETARPPATPSQPAGVPAEDLPDWLVDLQPAAPGEAATVPETASPAPGSPDQFRLDQSVSSADIDALMNMPLDTHVDTQAASSPAMPVASTSLSLEESDLDSILGPLPEAPAPETPPRSEINPKKKTGLFLIAEARAASAAASPSEPEVAEAKPATALPDFVADLRPSDMPIQFKIGGAVDIGIEEAPLAQLTDQMRQLRDHALAFKPPEPSQAANAGPLADLAGPLAAEPVIVRAATGASPSAISAVAAATDPQLRRVEVIRRLLEIEGDESQAAGAAKVKPTARPAVRLNVERLIISLILLAFIVAPFFTHALNVVAPPNPTALSAAQSASFNAVFNAIDGLPTGQTPVLIAFEYGPTGAGEMDDLARVLLRDLFKHGAKPIIVSTDFAGAMHAESLLSTFGHDPTELQALNRSSDKPLLARMDYVVLPFLPAGAAGVRTLLNVVYGGAYVTQTAFTSDIEGQPSGLNLQTDLFALRSTPVIVLAETPEDVRNWVEQYRAPPDVSAAPAKIILATSAAADATARTYSKALPQTIFGPLVGVRDATLYQALRQTPLTPNAVDRLLQRWQSIGLGALVAAVLIVVGALFGLLNSFRRREVRS
jgi:hypothetical protein